MCDSPWFSKTQMREEANLMMNPQIFKGHQAKDIQRPLSPKRKGEKVSYDSMTW